MGTGMAGTVAEHELERMEAFFRDHGSACLIDLCPLADPSVIAFVQSRPYRVIEFNNVLARRIRAGEEILPVENVRRAGDGDGDLWARVVAEGFSELMPISEDTLQMLRVAGGHSQRWLADGENPRAAAAMGMHSGVALFYADATHISARRRGWQSALIRARLAEAKAAGCDLAVATVLPGSASHRNYERAGFELIYMRVNVMREFGTQR
jgi:GNAT superfamily N-acetyltransferase